MKTPSIFLALICFLAFSFTAQAQVDKSSTKRVKKANTDKFKNNRRGKIYRDSLFLKNNLNRGPQPTQTNGATQRSMKNRPGSGVIYRDSLFMKNNLKRGPQQTQNAGTFQRNMKNRPGSGKIYRDSLFMKNRPGGLQPQSTKSNAQQISNRPGRNGRSIIASGNATPLAKENANRRGRKGKNVTRNNQGKIHKNPQNRRQNTQKQSGPKRKGKKKNNN